MGIINERIKEKRLNSGLTLLQVAEKLGIKDATVQRYESGEIKNIKHEVISKLAEIFNCSPAYLMGWENNEDQSNSFILNSTLETKEKELVENYRKLNTSGKDEAIKRVDELTYIDKYTNQNIMTLDGAKEYLKTFKMAAYGGENINTLTDEQIIDRAMALKHEFEEVPHKYKK